LPDTLLDQRLTSRQKLRLVHCQHTNRDSADCGDSDEGRVLEPKVFVPDILARVVKPHDITSSGVVACNIRTLVAVTVEATESQVIGF
jgi:hypothetical protein